MRLLVLRFSSMGDVALLTPVLHALASEHTNLSITLVTRKVYEPFFYNIPGVEVIGVNVERDYRGITGLYRLYRELRKLGPYNHGIDVHGSLRSRILKFFFRLKPGLEFASIVKGRREKHQQTRRSNKVLTPISHMVERYMHVFERAGFSALPERGPWINPDTHSRQLAKEFLLANQLTRRNNLWIGIAPFAGHTPKMWPLEYVRDLLKIIATRMDATVFLYGGGKKEVSILEEMHSEFSNTVLVAGKLNLEGEMALFLRMHLVLAMDSFNMHLAALLGVNLLSIWGSTHPYSGFGPYGKDESSIIQVPVDQLTCRPCSIFGNRGCYRGDLACMYWIKPEQVFTRIEQSLQLSHENQTNSGAPNV
ncbi:MAG: glycosyltransferase family 9 protein [Leptospiraceae bacterium]|nr:glycosyltransferase family 9 protein [Leptospiraceae bacterium]